MTIRAYCDAAYAIILRELQRPLYIATEDRTLPGLSLEDALEKLVEWAVGVHKTEKESEEAAIVRQNQQAMAQFEAMMAGL